ncbi:MAG: bifunctional adenosylcobinamide kinase/adenosylcobinamide-phosphate guanylyltransferase [Bacillota bacterium]|nr:bifunctional adenosylcobinamide kinase/adenosylcobinamide-phosphate guanylyltransferase [Bacillota bacterium]
MNKGVLILGGARSGKSTFAESLAKSLTHKVLYIATAIPFDDGMRDRIKKHQKNRPSEWKTVEKYRGFEGLRDFDEFIGADVILLDCITVMITNLMLDEACDYDQITHEELDNIENRIVNQIDVLLDELEASGKKYILVSNEVGLGLVPPYKLGNYFRDIAGRINQRIASVVGEVYFVVSGIQMKIK